MRTFDGTSQGYSFEIEQSDGSDIAANTWTHVVVTVPGNANITVDNNNQSGLQLAICGYLGSDYTAAGNTLNTWAGWNGGSRTPDMTNTWANTANATMDITGLQITPTNGYVGWINEDYPTTLAKCQRYCYVVSNANPDAYLPITGFAKANDQGVFTINYPVRMRVTNPTFTLGQVATNFKIFARATQVSVTNMTQSDVTDMGGNYNVFCAAGSLDVGDSLVLGTGANAGGDGFIISADL